VNNSRRGKLVIIESCWCFAVFSRTLCSAYGMSRLPSVVCL